MEGFDSNMEARADKRSNVKINTVLHNKMLKLKDEKPSNVTLIMMYEEAIKDYIAKHTGEKIVQDSKMEEIIDERFRRMDKHLSSMLGKFGMDISMNFMAMLYFASSYYEKDAAELYELYRKDGLDYFKGDLSFRNRKED